MITNRGVKVYPDGLPETFRTDHWRCRFLPAGGGTDDFEQVLELLRALHDAGSTSSRPSTSTRSTGARLLPRAGRVASGQDVASPTPPVDRAHRRTDPWSGVLHRRRARCLVEPDVVADATPQTRDLPA
jgi:hypothetical protein